MKTIAAILTNSRLGQSHERNAQNRLEVPDRQAQPRVPPKDTNGLAHPSLRRESLWNAIVRSLASGMF
ncbi:MAG: hypothetical protein AB9869_26325 [Verrucomicrobiia bacterium]